MGDLMENEHGHKNHSGIQRRWMTNIVSWLVALIVLSVVVTFLTVQGYYYSNMRSGMEAKARTASDFFSNYINLSYNEYYQSCVMLTQTFEDKNKMEMQFIGADGGIVASSSGLWAGSAPGTSDIDEAGVFKFEKTAGNQWEYGFWLKTNNAFSNPAGADSFNTGSLNKYDKDRRPDWEAQVFFDNGAGLFAVRSTNAPYNNETSGWNWIGNTYWTVNEGPLAEYSWEPQFVWNLEKNGTQKAASVRSYLKNRRGISPEQASRLCLGFVPDWNKVVRYVCVQKKFPKEVLDEVCCVENEDGYTAVGKTHVLSIPYECGGELKGFLFRRVDDTKDGPKYIANANLDRKSVFFNMAADRDPKQIVIVEGEMDALKATAEGVENVVAIGGSEIAGERRRQVEDAFRRGVDRIILCLDLDPLKDNPAEPNEDGLYSHVMRSVHTIKDVVPSFEEIYVVRFPEISDPDEYIRNHGVGEFLRLLDAAEPYWEYVYGYNKARRK